MKRKTHKCVEIVNSSMFLILAILSFNGLAINQEYLNLKKIQASDGKEGDRFGQEVSILHNRAIVGAEYADTELGVESGVAYIYDFDGENWLESAKLMHEHLVNNANDRFGNAVGLYENQAIVGAPRGWGMNSTNGSVYIFEHEDNNWNFKQRLAYSGLNTYFGDAISISGNRMIIGAPGHGTTGSVLEYVYDGNTWNFIDIFSPQKAPSGGNFGQNVVLNGSTALVGAPHQDNENGFSSGAAYIFEIIDGKWQEKAMFVNNEGSTFDYFGTGLSISDEWALVGAPWEANGGSAYLYQNNGGVWSFTKKIEANNLEISVNFGKSVFIKDNLFFISLDFTDEEYSFVEGNINVYQYINGSLLLTQNIKPPELSNGSRFGVSMDVFNQQIIVGASLEDGIETDTGAAFIMNYDLILQNGFE